MSEREGNTKINFIEAERIHTARGSFSIYQVNARQLEDIERVVGGMRTQGLVFGTPESFDSPIARPYFKHKPIVIEGYEDLSVTVYLTDPPR